MNHVDMPGVRSGKSNGGVIASSLYDDKKRYMLEMEGVTPTGCGSFPTG